MTSAGFTGPSGLSIRHIEAIPYVIPLVHPVRWARGEMVNVDNVLVRVTLSDGTQGIADAPSRPTILGDTQKSIVAIIDEQFAPRLIGLDAFDLARFWRQLDSVAGNLVPKGALDMALHDAQAKALGISCAKLLGGAMRPLPVNWRLRQESATEMLRDADTMIGRFGFRALKVKGSADPRRDLAFLRTLRSQCGDGVSIAIDFNQSLSTHALLNVLPALEDLGIALIEEPLPAGDTAGRLLCAAHTTIPISGDDSCFTPEDVLRELKLGAIRAVVLKVARNGYRPARDIVALCRVFHVPLHSGSQGDMHISACSAAHFACSYEAAHEHEFSTFLDARDHICDRDLEIADGCLIPPDGLGIGVSVDAKKLETYRIDH
jgi:L-alanine-DL-glutamate epimerase-like enolase superfamily enzyme